MLEERAELRRVGENLDHGRVDVRVVAATNADLARRMEAGEFREDLYYRLAVFAIELPPLRQRKGDLAVLAEHFLAHFAARYGRTLRGFTKAAMRALEGHAWPGNVRELRNVVEQAVVREEGEWVRPGSFRLLGAAGPRPAEAGGLGLGDLPDELELARDRFERAHILAVLEEEGGVVTRATKRLGIARGHFYRKCTTLGIDPDEVRRRHAG